MTQIQIEGFHHIALADKALAAGWPPPEIMSAPGEVPVDITDYTHAAYEHQELILSAGELLTELPGLLDVARRNLALDVDFVGTTHVHYRPPPYFRYDGVGLEVRD